MNRYSELSPAKALIWRITHRANLPWILGHGLHCANSGENDPGFVSIGNADLIGRRSQRAVPIPPGGMLSDYIPFYFTPFSVMMYNIHTGRGVAQRANEEIVILVSSLHRVAELGVPFVFTDRHAYVQIANYYRELDKLNQIDWARLQSRDFARRLDEPDKLERYQAEALIHRRLPVNGLIGIMCFNATVKAQIDAAIASQGLEMRVHARPSWYF